MHRVEIQGFSIVAVGDFNPKIFQPQWFAMQELITSEEASRADVEIIHPDLCSFSLEWCSIQVTRERYLIRTLMDPYFERLRDITLNTFSLLEHTPVRMIGMNFDVHYSTRSQVEWHDIGHQLAPKDLWSETLDNPGLRSLVVQESVRRDKRTGHIQVRVEPSNQIANGIFLHMNDHYQLQTSLEPAASKELVEILDQGWATSSERWKQTRDAFERFAGGLD